MRNGRGEKSKKKDEMNEEKGPVWTNKVGGGRE